MGNEFINSVIKRSNNYRKLAEKAIDKIPESKLTWTFNKESNSAAILIKHISGNMISRWTDFLTSDGEKKWRNRPKEFENEFESKENLIKRWNEGWDCYLNALNSLKEEDLLKKVKVNGKEYTVTDAINIQYAHYTYHIGQLVYSGKMICGEEWNAE